MTTKDKILKIDNKLNDIFLEKLKKQKKGQRSHFLLI